MNKKFHNVKVLPFNDIISDPALISADIIPCKKAKQKRITTANSVQQELNDLKKILDSSLDVICTIDEEGRFVTVSAASERIWGFKPNELTGKKLIDFVFEDDKEITIKTDAEIISGKPVTVFENRYVHKNGSVVPVLWSSRWDDKDRLLYCVAKDATEKKKLENALKIERQQFYDLFLQAPSCIGVLHGPNHVFEMSNTLYLRLIGKKDKKEIIGKRVAEVLPEVVKQGFILILDEVYKTGKTFTANELLVNLDYEGNGELTSVYLNIMYQAYRNNEGKIEGIFFFTVDVTEQVLSRKKIEGSEKRFRQIVETAQEGIWIIDEKNKTTFVNPKMCEMVEYEADELMGKEIQDFMDEEERKNSYEQIKRRKKGESESHNLRFITKSGKQLWTHISTNPIFDSSENYKGALAMVTDITENIAAQQAVQESEKKYRQMIETAQEGIWMIDEYDKTNFVNLKMCEMLGYTADEMMGHDIKSFMDEEEKKISESRIKKRKMGISETIDSKYITKSGKSIWTSLSANSIFGPAGEYKGALAMVTDITGRKLAEEKLQENQEQLLASQRIAHIGSWQLNFPHLTNDDSHSFSCSAETFRIFGLLPVEGEVSYLLLFQYVHPEDHKVVKDCFTKAVAENSSCATDFRIINKDGSQRWVRQQAKMVSDTVTGKPIKIFGTITDITQNKEHELQIKKNSREREKLIAQLTNSIKDLKQFTFITSHNFKSPLSNLTALLDLIDYSTLTDDNKEIVEMFRGSTAKLNKTINDLIRILIIKNNVNADLADNDINEILNEVCITLQPEINQACCTIKRKLEVGNIYFNKLYLQSILTNLLSNALKFRSPDRTLQVDIITEQKQNGEVLMTVKDNGIGIDLKRHQDKIFGLYQRFHSNADGLGLGLFIVKSQITTLGGDITVQSEVDKGTAFEITFREKP